MVYGVVYPLLMDRLGKNRKNDEELDKDCVEKEFPLARVKSYINGGGGRKAIVMGNCSINVWDGPKLEFDSYFVSYFPIFLLSGISSTLIFKVHYVLP